MQFSADERRVLLAGLEAGQARDQIWRGPMAEFSLDRLRQRGLVEFTEQRGANGQILISIATGLSKAGVRAASQIRDAANP